MRVERARHLLAGVGLAVIMVVSAGGSAAATDYPPSPCGDGGCHPAPPDYDPYPDPEPEPEPPIEEECDEEGNCQCLPVVVGIGTPGGTRNDDC